MNFSFLNPWLWLGALAVAAPIWLHLRRKTETNVIKFSAVRFLEDQPLPRRSPLRLQDVLLFLLRLLALLLVVGAFAWPYDPKVAALIVKESRVYILDNTLSHQANNGFARDRDRVISELGNLGRETQAAVVELSGQPRVLVGFGDERKTATLKLQQLKPSFQRGSYQAAFRQANTLLANSLGERKRIVFLGDNQENQWSENVSSPPFLHRVQVDLPNASAGTAPNLSVAEPQAQRIFLGDKSLVNFTARLSHAGPAKTATMVLRANGQVIFNREVDLDKQPGTILLQAQWEADPKLWLRGDVALDATPDVLAGDNKVFFSLPPVREGKVALLAQSSYLRLALSPDVMRGQWAARVIEPTKIAAELDGSQDAEVLVVESNYLQSGDARKLVWRYLTNGRGVILLVNKVTPAVSGALRELGFETVTTPDAPKMPSQRFQYVFTHHPIFHPFLSPDYGNLMEVKVHQRTRLKAMQGMPLIFSDTGEPLFFQGTKVPAKLYVSTFGFDRRESSWPVHLTFIPFLDLCLQNARPEDPTPVNYEPGEIASVALPAKSTVREVVLRDGDRELQRVPVAQGKAQLRLPEEPGIYTVTYDSATEPEKMFNVNPSPKESQLSYVDKPEALKVWQVSVTDETAPAKPTSSQASISLAAIWQQQLWWWLLLAGLAALVLETAWSALRKERL